MSVVRMISNCAAFETKSLFSFVSKNFADFRNFTSLCCKNYDLKCSSRVFLSNDNSTIWLTPDKSRQEQTRIFTQTRSSSNRGSSRTGFRVQEVITPLLLWREAGARPLEDTPVGCFHAAAAVAAVRVLLRPLEAVLCAGRPCTGCPCTISGGRGPVVLERLLLQPFSWWRPTYAISWACDLRTCPTSWDTFRVVSEYRAHK